MLNDSHLFNINDFIKQELIGKGDFGEVFSVKNSKTQDMYTVKTFYEDINKYPENFTDVLLYEINSQLNLNQRFISPIIGYNFIDLDGEKRLLTLSKYFTSSLKGIIANKVHKDPFEIINQISLGMRYLHSKDIIHQNLKPSNILIDDNDKLYISDFGSLKNKYKKSNELEFNGTSIYTAPEIWKGENYTKSSDVYSFSIIAYEILTGSMPFQNLSPFQIISKIINGDRPKINSSVFLSYTPMYDKYMNIIEKCWANDPENRPTFDQIVTFLGIEDENEEEKQKNDDDFVNKNEEESYSSGFHKISSDRCYRKTYDSEAPPRSLREYGRKKQKKTDSLDDVFNDSSGLSPRNSHEQDHEIKQDEFDDLLIYLINGIDENPIENEQEKNKEEEDFQLLKKDEISYSNIKTIDLDSYEKKSKIGEGSFGRVYKINSKSEDVIYVAKISKKNITNLNNKDDIDAVLLFHEINIHSRMNHPLILKFIGYSSVDFKKQPNPVIISEYVVNGSLDNILEMENKSLAYSGWNSTKKLIIIYGIASAMLYLHKHNILHLDLKAENILVDENFYPKISDFGLSKDISNDEINCENNNGIFRGTPTRIAPEVWRNSLYTKSVDVYAFAFTVYEIMTNEKPFSELKNVFQIMNEVSILGHRPKFPACVPKRYCKLIDDCWSQNPGDRPSFEEIVDSLKNDLDFVTEAFVDLEEYQNFIETIDNMTIENLNQKQKIISREIKLDSNDIGKSKAIKKTLMFASPHKKIVENDIKIVENDDL